MAPSSVAPLPPSMQQQGRRQSTHDTLHRPASIVSVATSSIVDMKSVNITDDHHHHPPKTGFAGFRQRMQHVFHSPFVHYSIIVLTVLDLFCVMGEMIISQHYCGKHEPHEIEVLSEFLGYSSLAILCIFALELLLHMIAAGPIKFFKDKHHLLDFLVVYSSLIVDVASKHKLLELLGLVIIVRLWRIIRVMHATFEVSLDKVRKKAHTRKIRIRELEKLLQETQDKVRQQM